METKFTKGPWSLFITRDQISIEGYRDIAEIDLPDEEDIANARLIAQSPALFAFACWAIQQFQGESGAGENYWEDFPEYEAGKEAVSKVLTP